VKAILAQLSDARRTLGAMILRGERNLTLNHLRTLAWHRACLPRGSRRARASLASFDKREDAGEMKQPDALDPAGFTNGDGANEAFGRPLVELWARAAGIKLMPTFWCPNPHWKITIPVASQL